MDMQVGRIRSNGRIARIVRKRLAPIAIAALMLGVAGAGLGAPQAHAGIVTPGAQAGGSSEASVVAPRKAGGDQGEYAAAQDSQQATSDTPPVPGIIAVL